MTDGLITYVGADANYVDKPGSAEVDATGKTVMPGIIDSYVRGTEYLAPDFAGQTIRRSFLLDGVTSTCNTGHSLASSDSFEVGPYVDGVALGRVYNSGPQLSFRITPTPPDDVVKDLYEVGFDSSEIVAAVDDISQHGAEFVKISIGQDHDPRNPTELGPAFTGQQLDVITLNATTRAMHVRGTLTDERYGERAVDSDVKVIDFTPAFRSLDSLLNPDNSSPYVFAYTSSNPTDAAAIEKARSILADMAVSGKLVVPMISVLDQQYPWTRPSSARSMYEEVVHYYKDIGGRIAYGTAFEPGDTPGVSMDEVFALRRSGLTNHEIVRALTNYAAIACGAEDEVGTIETGKIGDLLLLDGNVLEDISALDRPTHVILDGKLAKGE